MAKIPYQSIEEQEHLTIEFLLFLPGSTASRVSSIITLIASTFKQSDLYQEKLH